MGQKILSYSTAIAISLFLLFSLEISAQNQQRPYVNPTPKRDQKKNVKEEPKEEVPLYNGTYIGVDLYGLGSKLFGSDFLSSEVDIVVNLKNMFLPTAEIVSVLQIHGTIPVFIIKVQPLSSASE